MAFNLAYDFAFELIAQSAEGEDVTPAMLIAACRKRLDSIESAGGAEILEACGLFDCFEVKEEEEGAAQ